MKKILLLAIILLAFGFVKQAHAAITFDATSTVTRTGVTVATTTITVNSGSNEALIILDAWGNATSALTGITVDGVSVPTSTQFDTGSRHAAIGVITNIAAGTHNVSTSYAANCQVGLTVASFFGVNQSTPVDATSTKTATQPVASDTITTTVANDLIVDVVDLGGTATTTSLGVNQTYLAKNLLTGANNGSTDYQVVTSTQTYNPILNLSKPAQFVMVTAAIEPAPVSATTAAKWIWWGE